MSKHPVSLAPYLHSKNATKIPPRYLDDPFTFPHPHPTSPQEVDANVAAINIAYASGTLDYDSTQLMLAGQREFIVRFKAREDAPGNTAIEIRGGLPELPGCPSGPHSTALRFLHRPSRAFFPNKTPTSHP